MLKDEGIALALNSNSPDFEKELQEAAKQFSARICFDAVGGELTGVILRNMPNGSKVYVYGALSGESVKADVLSFIFQKKEICGFWLTDYLKQKSIFSLFGMCKQVSRCIMTSLKSNISKSFSLIQFAEALEYYKHNMTEGKVIIKSDWSEQKASGTEEPQA